jgi:hypothetical protein
MAIVRTDDKHYKAIADAIRSLGGYSDTYRPEELPTAVGTLSSDSHVAGINQGRNEGYQEGYTDGNNEGYNRGLTVGFENGEKAQYDEFWDTFQENGKAKCYYFAFSYDRFDDNTFNPKYDIKASNGTTPGRDMFTNNEKITDTKVAIFCNSNNADRCFNNATNLETIRRFDVKKTTTFTNTFSCSKLKNITITGEIGQNIDFSSCKLLTHDSLVGKIATQEQITEGVNLVTINGTTYYGGILGALYDYSAEGVTKTLTLGTTNLAKLTDAEKAIATEKGWTLA